MRLQPPDAAFARRARWVVFISANNKVNHMPDDNKRPHDLKLWLTDREFIDLCKLADNQDRKPGELGRVILRKYMYGNVGAAGADCNGANSADQCQAD